MVFICMVWINEIFQKCYCEVGVVIVFVLVFGLGNFGSIVMIYVLYIGWFEDVVLGWYCYCNSNFVMIGIFCMSIVSSFVMIVLFKVFGNEFSNKIVGSDGNDFGEEILDGVVCCEVYQCGFSCLIK